MAEILLFHHALGQTPGFLAFAEELRQGGHIVHTPDLYEGRTFDTIENGVAHARSLGFETIINRGQAAASRLPHALVYAGFSLGVMPAQMLAQTRPGAKGALLFHACVPITQFGSAWPGGVPVQIHGMDADESFVKEGDLDAARSSSPLRTPSCSSTQETSTCSPIRACPPTTKTPQRCSCSACCIFSRKCRLGGLLI